MANKKQSNENESRTERFTRLATSRVNRVLKALRILGNCSSSNYSYTQEQVDKMFETIYKSVETTRNKFSKASDVKPFEF